MKTGPDSFEEFWISSVDQLGIAFYIARTISRR